ncbi:MAG: penicillin-binding protein [Proteobacteria bacterium]|nr:MAG: penicillin-binding protein [Pseudomonadota bacterium]
MLRKLLIVSVILGVLVIIAGGLAAVWGYNYITRDLPRWDNIQDYEPPAVSTVFARDGTMVGEFYSERRYPAKLQEIPLMVRNAFLASEDAAFYKHPGIDPASIVRAFVANLRQGEAKQGGSTITQQVVKNLLLTPEKKITRKIKEAILSYRIEKQLSKDEILEIYLNQIFFGNTAYGIKAAARLYYRKELADLTLAEAAILAGLPKAPSRFSPILNPDRARKRQRYVLNQMVKAGFISESEANSALDEKVRVYPANTQNIFHAPFYVSEVRRVLGEKWRDLLVDTAGLQIYTALDLKADQIATESLRKGLRETDKRRGWRGPIGFIKGADRAQYTDQFGAQVPENLEMNESYPALVVGIGPKSGMIKVLIGEKEQQIDLAVSTWAKKRLDKEDRVSFSAPHETIKLGDVIEVGLVSPNEPDTGKTKPDGGTAKMVLAQTPEIEGAVSLVDPYSGEVYAAVGGYSYQRSVFNRATQSYRQPGSAFKPIVYLAAVDGFNYTPSTIVFDSPRTFKVGDQYWTPGNFDEKFLGPITLRVALEKSRNLVSADIVSRIGVDAIVQYSRKLGIESRIGRNLSIALGSSEVTLLELTRAYGVFAAKGVLMDSVFVTRILDRNGKVIYDYANEKLSNAKQVISENSAFVMAYMMKGVVDHGTGYRVKEIGRPVAGKTGTSNEEMDTWFVGYTPQWVCGVWVGFDQKKRIGEKETGGRVAAPIWLYFMRDYLNSLDQAEYAKLEEETKQEAHRLGIEYTPPEKIEPLDFSPPEGVDPFWVNKQSGRLAHSGEPGAILEYFVKGTEPVGAGTEEEISSSYLELPEL